MFSARVLHNSKCFQKNYEDRILSVLKAKSPFYIEEMSDDELLDAHNIHSYAQTLEWKGTLQYIINDEKVIDSSSQIYGTIINTQTMEHARAYALSGCKRIMTIENKANYEDMSYRKDTLYIFCHGFSLQRKFGFEDDL